MRAVFRVNPDARIKTMWVDYKGAMDFKRKFGATAHKQVGSMMFPAYADQICKCRTGSWIIDLSNSEGLESYRLKPSMFGACPFTIMDVSHYRPDGSCKCDDPAEQARMIREWGYTREDFAA
jgi:hypothetical protein